jgi:hypothetical protein
MVFGDLEIGRQNDAQKVESRLTRKAALSWVSDVVALCLAFQLFAVITLFLFFHDIGLGAVILLFPLPVVHLIASMVIATWVPLEFKGVKALKALGILFVGYVIVFLGLAWLINLM